MIAERDPRIIAVDRMVAVCSAQLSGSIVNSKFQLVDTALLKARWNGVFARTGSIEYEKATAAVGTSDGNV